MTTAPLTPDQLTQAKAQIAATKLAAVQPLIDALNGSAVTALLPLAETALDALDTGDVVYQSVQNLQSIIANSAKRLTSGLAPLAKVAATATPS